MSGAIYDQNCTGPDCSQTRLQRIYDYLDGVLTDQELSRVEQHLQECKHCEHEYDLECVIRAALKRSCCEKAPQQLRTAIRMSLTQVTVYRNE